jgi:23S rRNA (guanosine2251-2'-O)-methyltransferase
MAGNSQRRGAIRKGDSKKGATVGSGGQRRRGLEGKGPTPKAADRPNHKAHKMAKAAAKRGAAGAGRPGGGRPSGGRRSKSSSEIVAGRNSVVEALRANIPVTTMYVAGRIDADDRVREALKTATERGIPILETPRGELDRLTDGAVHQGLALQVPPYAYLHPDDLLARALEAPAPLVVALDGVTDPRNLGAVVRSAAAFGAQGVLLPERRSAGMTAAAWRTSAGAAARLPVARCTNLARTLTAYKEAGLFVVGLAAGGTVSLDDLEVATSPLVVVVGSEGDGLGRLVEETCDLTVSIPMSGLTESLNAGIAAAVTLAEVARRRRSG